MPRTALCALWMLFVIGIAGSRPIAAQDTGASLSEREPRFLLATGPRATPRRVDIAGTPVLAKQIAISLDNVSLDEALRTISGRSGLQLAYSTAMIPPGRRVRFRAEEITVAGALSEVLRDVGVDVLLSSDGKAVLVRRGDAFIGAQAGAVVGRATDAKSGEAIGGADVSLDSGRWRTVTGADGRYRLAEVPTGSYTVVARRIGYGPERRAVTVVAGQEAIVDVVLQAAATKLGEVVVTAQKREERLQDVPLSIAAVAAEEIDRRGLVSAEDYLRGIPGVSQTTDQFGQSIVIRGVETSLSSQNFFGAATVATYFGETPTTNTAGMTGSTNVDAKLVDIERVEVLRGPQGTAFGSAALGGAVRTIPVAPKLDRVEGKVAAGYSATSGTGGDNYSLQGAANLPLVRDRLAVRAVGFRYEDSGFYRNVAGSDPDANVQTAITQYGAQAFAVDAEEVGTSRFTGGRIAALFQASEDLKVTLNYLTQKGETDGWPLANTNTYEQSMLQVAPEHAYRGQRFGFFDSDIDIANAVMEYDLGWANLLGTYSYVTSGSNYAFPFSRTAPWPLSYGGRSEHREHSGEIRLTTHLDGAWNFLGGLYVEDLDDEGRWDPYWHGSPETNLFAPGQSGSMGSEYRTRRDLTQKAAFAEASWEFLPGFTLTGGARVYGYDRTEVTSTSGAFFGSFGPAFQGHDASGTSFRGNLSYKVTDNALVYAGWGQGFRLGRAQTGLNPATCDPDGDGIIDGTTVTIESTRTVNSDNGDNYELGGKFTLLDGRLLIAADVYRFDWSGVPVLVSVESFGGPGQEEGCYPFYTANLGGARSEGLEFQANFYLTQALRLDVGSGYVRARLTTDAVALNSPAGTRLPGSPEVNANLGLQYEFKLGGSPAFVRADPIYVGSFTNGLGANAPASAGGYVKVDASARVAIRSTNIDVFMRNLTNADDFTLGGGVPTRRFIGHRLRPRTIGLQLSRNF